MADWGKLVLLLATFAACPGCVSTLGSVIVATPNHSNDRLEKKGPWFPPTEKLLGVDEHLRIEVGPPKAVLATSIIHPAHDKPPRGTILVLHGMGARSFWMHGTARNLADEGYRSVLIDLRGHGGSSGKRMTYGLQEARDVSQIVDELSKRHLIEGPIGVFGISYGAATAIHLAAIDKRIRAVVAVSPFSDMRSEVSHYVRTVGLPAVGPFLSEEYIQRAVDEAGEIGGFEPDWADAAIAIQYSTAPVLLIHGTADMFVPAEHSRRLHAAAPLRSKLVLLRGVGHFSAWLDRKGEVATATQQWFEACLR